MSAAARDRSSQRPPFSETVRHRTLANGAELYVLENHFNPTLAIAGSLKAGRLYAPADRRLIGSLTAGELMKGTARRTKLELAEDLESRAVSLSFSSDASDPVGVDVGGAALSRDVDRLLDALVEVLTSPAFPEEELEKEKKRLVGSIRQSQDQTGARAWEAAARRLYPPSHPLYLAPAETRIARVEALGREDLAGFYEARYGAASLALVVVGDVEAERVLDRLEGALGGWRRGPEPSVPRPPVPAPAPGSETVAMPDKANADVVIAAAANLSRTDPDFFACTLANAALGQSSLTSRLGVRVRDTEGLTYGIHSSFSAGHVPGPFTINLSVKPESRDAALSATLDEVARFLKSGMTDKELAEEKSSRIGRFKVDLGSNAGMAGALDSAIYYGFGVGYLDAFPARVAEVTKERADAAFAARVRPEAFTVVSAGTFGRAPDGAGSRPADVKESGRR